MLLNFSDEDIFIVRYTNPCWGSFLIGQALLLYRWNEMPDVKILEWAWWWEASKRPSEKDGKPFSESGDKIVPIDWPPRRYFWSDKFNNS